MSDFSMCSELGFALQGEGLGWVFSGGLFVEGDDGLGEGL
jgi:hypothetical protein